VTTDEETNDEMTVNMKCLDKSASSSTYFNNIGIFAASLALVASIMI